MGSAHHRLRSVCESRSGVAVAARRTPGHVQLLALATALWVLAAAAALHSVLPRLAPESKLPALPARVGAARADTSGRALLLRRRASVPGAAREISPRAGRAVGGAVVGAGA